MEQIKKFLHGKGFALVLAACLLAAAAAGVWAVRHRPRRAQAEPDRPDKPEQHRPADHSGAGT